MPATTDEAAPAAATGRPELPDVVAALAWVAANMGGIAKVKRSANEPGDREFYAYRGIDQIAAVAQPLLGQAGVVIVPTEGTITTIEPITVNNRPWTDTTVTVVWTIYGPNGTQLSSITQGVGRDNSDKGYNKAMTQAFKNLLLRLLCVGDPQDDADAPQHQGNATDATLPPPEETPERQYAREVFDAVKAIAGTAAGDRFVEWRKTNPGSLRVNDLTADPEWAMKVLVAVGEAISGAMDGPQATPDAPAAPVSGDDSPAPTDTAPTPPPDPGLPEASGKAAIGSRAAKRQAVLDQAAAEGLPLESGLGTFGHPDDGPDYSPNG